MPDQKSSDETLKACGQRLRPDQAPQLLANIERKGWLRSLAEPPLRALGIEPIPIWNVSRHAHEFVQAELLRDVFAAKQIDCVFDVGAFNGHFGRYLREKVGFTGTILSFEPQPAPFVVLAESARLDDKWHVFPVALGAEPGEVEMHITSKLWFSSFLQPSDATPLNMKEGNTTVANIRATIERLDDRFDELAAKYSFSRPFLKMDTQGFDLRVLEGAQGRVDRFLGLQSELSLVQIYSGMPTWTEALEAYRKAGFEVSGFFPVSRDTEFRAVEVDVVMVRAVER